MPSQLDRILAHTLIEVERRKAAADLPEMERRAAAHRPRGFAAHLRETAQSRPAVIAELKRASPSRGVIRAELHPAEMARTLESAGAAALSVLTDSEFFRGSLADLTEASQAVAIPCLRKDFILDPFQILEARAAGADAVLLIVAALDDSQISLLQAFAVDLGLDVLVEVHDRSELDRAVALEATVIGVNSRDLRSFTVDTDSLLQLADALPSHVLRVAESGIRSPEDIHRLQEGGYQAFLVGEALMRQPDPAAALALLLGQEFSVDL